MRRCQWLVVAAMLPLTLAFLFHRSFDANSVMFSNDGPYGQMQSEQTRLPDALTGLWQDLNWLGGEDVSPAPTFSTALRLWTQPRALRSPVALFVGLAYAVVIALIIGANMRPYRVERRLIAAPSPAELRATVLARRVFAATLAAVAVWSIAAAANPELCHPKF